MLLISTALSTSNAAPSVVDFEEFQAGDTVHALSAPGLTVTALKKKTKKGKLRPTLAMIFDSSDPSGGDFDLGSPNEDFGGPGIGAAGGTSTGSLFPNDIEHGMVLIIAESDDSTDPDDNALGGTLTFDFELPTDVKSIGLLDNEEGAKFKVTTADGGSSTITVGPPGDNSFEQVSIVKPQVTQIVVTLLGSGAITSLELDSLEAPPSECSIDFQSFVPGQKLGSLSYGVQVTAQKRINGYVGPLRSSDAMVFDSENPTGDDFDLGTPNSSVMNGPGQGTAGQAGELFENVTPLGNVLIISEDGESSNPDDSAFGGILTFDFLLPLGVASVGLLDNDRVTTITVHTVDGTVSTVSNGNGGDNSFEVVAINKPMVTKMVVHMGGSGAISELSLTSCDF